MSRSTQVWSTRLVVWTAVAGVCAAQTFFSIDEKTVAKVESLSGQVSIIKDSYPWALNAGDSVRPGQQIITGSDGYAVFRVSDGSTFEVFANSRATFRANPGSWLDMIDLWIGRIRVHIQKWGGQPNPNRIHTPTAVISVRGTTFDVSVDEDDTTTVAVAEGQVAVRHRLIAQEEPKVVNPGEYIKVHKDAPIASRRFDKGGLVERGAKILADALWTIVLRGGSPGGVKLPGGGAPTGGGPTLPGDTGPTLPPPPPPPPSLPPPPGGGN
jgi:hypothetical protein